MQRKRNGQFHGELCIPRNHTPGDICGVCGYGMNEPVCEVCQEPIDAGDTCGCHPPHVTEDPEHHCVADFLGADSCACPECDAVGRMVGNGTDFDD